MAFGNVPTARAAGAVSLLPAPNATDVCPDAPLRIHFPTPPTVATTGKIEIDDAATHAAVESIDLSQRTAQQTIGGLPHFTYYPVIVGGNDVTIFPRDHALDYGKTYAVKIDAGALGHGTPTDWQFKTKAAPPATGTTNLTVAVDGTGDFATVQGALDFIPDGNTTPTTITIKPGTYTELVYVANKNGVTLAGAGPTQTVIEYANNNKFNTATDQGTYHRGVFLARHCADLVLKDLTIRNTTPQGGSQAEAIILNGTLHARAILSHVNLYSYQDTLQINGQAYVNKCDIEGDVDFMWGSGPVFFEDCICKGLRSKAYYTQIRNSEKNHGFVYYHCTFDAANGVKDIFLARIDPARFGHSEVVLVNCAIAGESVSPVAWKLDAPKGKPVGDVAAAAGDVHFWEYNSHDPEGKPVDTSNRLSISKQLTPLADSRTIADYSNPAYVLGGWNPRDAAALLELPTTKPDPHP